MIQKVAPSTIRSRYLRKEIIRLLGGQCCRCGFSDERALQIDHIDGKNMNDHKTLGRLAYLYAVVRCIRFNRVYPMSKKVYQLLCANCNWIKRAERKEHT